MPRPATLARISLAALALSSTAAASVVFFGTLGGERELIDFPLTALFAVLFLWTSFSFWSATFGFVVRLRAAPRPPPTTHQEARADGSGRLPRTALLMPIYNEDASRTMAGLRAIHESLDATGQGDRFDFFILSDTTDPDIWLEEELAWAHHKSSARGSSGIYYRRRSANLGKKSGNIADFCRQWGTSYTYMVVLDADSVMSGRTLVEMVRRMEEMPQVGILQAPPVLVNCGSVFARLQQFAAGIYGEIFTSGYALWTQLDGNYWGHNAIIRVKPFIECCGLSRLPGRPPLGGEILSHDFVEAALMRRSGWEVRIADDLDGSYEECPATVTDFVRRDRRWCQGNLQHIRLIFAYGFHPVSRIHFGMGAMSYLSSPLWLAFLLLSFLASATRRPVFTGRPSDGQPLVQDSRALLLMMVTTLVLFLPKLWGLLLLFFKDRRKLRAFGGAGRASASVVLESAVSTLTAPIFMVNSVLFVASILAGRAVAWGPQRRGDAAVDLRAAARDHALHTAGGLIGAATTAIFAPNLFWWTLPVTLGLVISAPLAVLLSSIQLGRRLRARGLFLVPEETEPPEVIQRQRRHLRAAQGFADLDAEERLRRVIVDPVLNALHCAALEAAQTPLPAAGRLRQVHRDLLARPRARLHREDKLALLSDAAGLRAMHDEAWRRWPLGLLAAGAAARPPS
jgi:membrane glycosyltransferase